MRYVNKQKFVDMFKNGGYFSVDALETIHNWNQGMFYDMDLPWIHTIYVEVNDCPAIGERYYKRTGINTYVMFKNIGK